MAQTKIYRLCIDSAAYAPYYKARLILCNAIQNSKSQTIKSRLWTNAHKKDIEYDPTLEKNASLLFASHGDLTTPFDGITFESPCTLKNKNNLNEHQ